TVDVVASRDIDVRTEVVRQRMAFEADPEGFAARYRDADAGLARRVAAARALVSSVELPDKELRRIAALCAAFDVDGMRADLVVARTAVAHAAWRAAEHGAPGNGAGLAVTGEDIRVAADLALPHRRPRDPFDDPGLDPERLDEAMTSADQTGPDPDPDPGRGSGPGPDSDPDPDPPGGGGAGSGADDGPPRQGSAPAPASRPSGTPSALFKTRTLVVPGVGEGAPGRRSRARNR